MTRSLGAAAILVFSAALVGGCNGNGDGDKEDQAGQAMSAPSIDITSSQGDIVTGDTTTLTVQDRNTIGRDAEIKWIATGGELNVEENGRVARARFDQPGTYTLTASLMMNGREVARDAVNITVRPLK